MAGIFNSAIFNNAIFNTGDVAVVVVQRGGTSKRDKKKKRVIHFSELSERERQEELSALAAEMQLRPFTEVEEIVHDFDLEDDELLLKVLTLTIH